MTISPPPFQMQFFFYKNINLNAVFFPFKNNYVLKM